MTWKESVKWEKEYEKASKDLERKEHLQEKEAKLCQEKEAKERAEWDGCAPYVDVLRRYRKLDAADQYCVGQRGAFVATALYDDGSRASDYALALTFDFLGDGDRKKHEARFFRIMRWSSTWAPFWNPSASVPSPMQAAATTFGLIPREGRERLWEQFTAAVRESSESARRVLLEQFSRAAFFPTVGESTESEDASAERRSSSETVHSTSMSGWLSRHKDKKRFYRLSGDGLDCFKRGMLHGSSPPDKSDNAHSFHFSLSLATATASGNTLTISVPDRPHEWLIAESEEEALAWANAITARANTSPRVEIGNFTAMGERDVLEHYKRAVSAGHSLEDLSLEDLWLAQLFVDVQVDIARDHVQFLQRVLAGYVPCSHCCAHP
jgi:hypothetical protein